MTLQADMQRVLDLQSSWSGRNTPEMSERGTIVRHEVVSWLEARGTGLSGAIGVPRSDFIAEGRDGTGMKTRVPWTRFGSRHWSPRATQGFYVVYLWAFDGSSAYLSLNQGTTDFENGDFIRKPLRELDSRVAWAREVLSDWAFGRHDFVPLNLGDTSERSLGRGYELGDVASVRYRSGEIPSDDRLLEDVLSFAGALGQLYDANEKAPLPYEVPELVAVEEAAADASGKPRPARGAGFRQSPEERKMLEIYAVDLAEKYYEADGWKVTRRGAPYDLELRRGDECWTVEVKGTTSAGEGVPLTRGEVEHHARAYPNNALVIVRGIELDRTTSPPTLCGGVLHELQPWLIDGELLKVISYKYSVPTDAYAPGSGLGPEDILG